MRACPRYRTPQERRDYARRRVLAEREATDLVAWREEMTATVREYRDLAMWLYHALVQCIIRACYCDDDELATLMDEADSADANWQRAEAALDGWQAASWDDILIVFRHHRRAA